MAQGPGAPHPPPPELGGEAAAALAAAPARLPQSHTCFRALDLPEYASKEELGKALITAIEYGATGFEFA
jgi:hypothetical protein